MNIVEDNKPHRLIEFLEHDPGARKEFDAGLEAIKQFYLGKLAYLKDSDEVRRFQGFVQGLDFVTAFVKKTSSKEQEKLDAGTRIEGNSNSRNQVG